MVHCKVGKKRYLASFGELKSMLQNFIFKFSTLVYKTRDWFLEGKPVALIPTAGILFGIQFFF